MRLREKRLGSFRAGKQARVAGRKWTGKGTGGMKAGDRCLVLQSFIHHAEKFIF